jgi:hypothetical protein
MNGETIFNQFLNLLIKFVNNIFSSLSYWLTEVHNKDKNEHERAIKILSKQLQNYLRFSESDSLLILECYTTALGWNDISYPGQVTKPIQQQIQHTQPQSAKTTQPILDINALKQQLLSELRAEISSSQQVQQPSPAPKPSYQQTPTITTIVKPSIGSIIKFGKYDWKVLDVQWNKALIISKEINHINMPYNEKKEYCTWETCTLRKWLNNDFLATFRPQEQSRICLSTIANEDNQWYKTKGGNNTQDRIFLLSISEVVKYFGDSEDYQKKCQKYYGGVLSKNGYYIDDRYNKKRICNYKGNATWWWLRSPGDYSKSVAYVRSNGSIFVRGGFVNRSGNSIRPALWLSLN